MKGNHVTDAIAFRQSNRRLTVLLGLGYLLLIIVLAAMFWGPLESWFGTFTSQRTIGLGLATAIVAIGPFFVLLRASSRRTEVVDTGSGLAVRQSGGAVKDIPYDKIARIVLNKPLINALYLYDESGNRLHVFSPMGHDDTLTRITQVITASRAFTVTESRTAAARGNAVVREFELMR